MKTAAWPTLSSKPLTASETPGFPEMDVSAPYRILVVDDNDASAKTLGWTLELIGHEVALAHDAQSAMETAQSFQPNVILLDIGLPDMNGYDTCRLMRQTPDTKNSVIIAQTGWGQEEHRRRSKEAGFDHHLVKPIQIQMLKELLASLGKQRILNGTPQRKQP